MPFIYDRRQETQWQLDQLQRSLVPSEYDPDEIHSPDIDGKGNFVHQRSWKIKERTSRGAQRFGVALRDSWIPFLGGSGGATLAITALNQGYSFLPGEVPWVIQAMIGGLVGWKTGEWSNRATVKAINLVQVPIRAFRERYYFKL